uniref:Mediator of RNA polymerase II transcription subunit 1 n=1 Tax=Amphilophus citrinellus TaxID=61819 RepID=A0A3Q0QVD8_AMPCI
YYLSPLLDALVMMDMLIIPNLRVKFAEKTWADTFQLVRRCMVSPGWRLLPNNKGIKLASQCLCFYFRATYLFLLVFFLNKSTVVTPYYLYESFLPRMSFHFTEAMCYLSADLFYVEVLLLPCGEVEEVKVVPHGESPVVSRLVLQVPPSIFEIFFNFHTFEALLLVSLQYLGKDLQKISHLPRCVTKELSKIFKGIKVVDFPELKPVVQAAQVTVGVSDVTHKLQMASVIPEPPQLDPQGYPVFVPLNEVPNEMLPACFLLKLQPAMPMMLSVVKQLSQITDATVPDVDLQWAPLPKLLMRGSLSTNNQWETSCENKSIFTVPLPGGVIHSYIFPGTAWDLPAHRGAVVDSVPFTHPGHVPALLELLRPQCTINTLLRSCFTSQCASSAGLVCGLPFEVLPESDTIHFNFGKI